MILLSLLAVVSSQAGGIESYQNLLSQIQSTEFSKENCVAINESYVREIPKLKLQLSDTGWLLKNGETLVKKTFYTRVKLRKQMQELFQNGSLEESCAISFKNLYRGLRGVEDYAGYILTLDRTYTGSVTSNPKGFLPANTLLADETQTHLEIKSGDIMISRGNAPTSAAIARMGDVDTQFSHLAFVYVDENKKAWTIEAHIEIGVVVAPLSEWFKDGKSRTAIFRYNGDPSVVQKAAKAVFERTAKATAQGENIHYDFAMDMNDHQDLFCSEVAKAGFDAFAPNGAQFPLFPSRFESANRYFLDLLAIEATQAFLPADMEIEPRFDFLGEWRSYDRIQSVWRKDAILTKMYEWIEKDGYRFDFTLVHNVKSKLALFLSKKFGMYEEKFPYYMPRKTMMTTFVLNPLVEHLEQTIEARERAARAKNPRFPFTYFETLNTLEQYKKEREAQNKGITKSFKKEN